MKNLFFYLLSTILIIGCKQQNNTPEIPVSKNAMLETKIDDFLNLTHQKGKLNGSVLVVKDDKTIYEHSFGYADGSKITLLSKSHRFNIGSVYKEFPAVAIMQLKEANKLQLDDKIDQYIYNLPNWSSEVSIKHLLQYSSGLPTINWNSFFSNNINATDNDILENLSKIKTLEFKTGTNYLYTNHSPILLMKIVEVITKMKFKEYANTHLFEPFGLKNTVIKEAYPYKNKELMAIPFNENFEEDNYQLSVSSVLFCSTTRDMSNWFSNLDAFKILKKESLKFLSETVKNGNNIQSPLGMGQWNKAKIIEHSHHGTTANYECIVRRFKQENLSITILTNQKNSNVYELSERIVKIVNNN